MTTLTDIELLVQKTAQEALKEDTPLDKRIDALRAVGPYYTALKKAAGQEPLDSNEPTMDDMRQQINDQEHGNGRNVQARTRSRN